MFTDRYAFSNISRAKGSPFETRRYAPVSGQEPPKPTEASS